MNMEITGKVYCFFEQSGTFKTEFIKLGFQAEDYDIQNNFGKTDHIVDLFKEIECAYNSEESIFDSIGEKDLIMAFFPCIYFCATSQMAFSFGYKNYRKLSTKEKTDKILERSAKREYFFSLAVKLVSIAKQRGIRLILENPWSEQTFLKANFVMPPTIIDNDRTKRGDYFVKPTAYWFINLTPTNGKSFQKVKAKRRVVDCKRGIEAGICSQERSMISSEYARNFICDFIVGKEQQHTMRSLFE